MPRHFWKAPIVLGALSVGIVSCGRETTPTGPAGLVQPQLSRQPVTAPTVNEEFERVALEEVPGFGGLFLNEAGETVVRLTTLEYVEQARDYARRRGQHSFAGQQRIVVWEADYDFAQLARWERLLLPAIVDGGVLSFDIDERSNRLRIGVFDMAAAGSIRRIAATLGVPSNALIVELADEARQFLTLRDRQRPTQGGFEINTFGSCTLGFSGRWILGYRIFVTNSHCSNQPFQPETTNRTVVYQPLTQSSDRIGIKLYDREMSRDCYQWFPCRWSDAAFFVYDAGVADDLGYIARTQSYAIGAQGSRIVDASSPRFEILGRDTTFTSVAGAGVYKMGSATGWTAGIITQTCVWRFIPEGLLRCQMVTDVYADHGDSGAPMFVILPWAPTKVVLTGILWGGEPGVTAYYSPFQGIQRDLGYISVCSPGSGC